MKLHKCGVLVIGSGAAGLRAAIAAHGSGADVIVLGKCRRGEAHTITADGISAAPDATDSWQIHAADTLREGCFLADYRAVETLCRNAADAIKELQEWGVEFAKDAGGNLAQRRLSGHTNSRTHFIGDYTGRAVMDALVREAKRRKILFLEEIYITSLAKHDGAVNGAIGFDMFSGDTVLFNSKVTVLAAGGYSGIYSRSTSRADEGTGDAVSLAFEAGAELQDMEMVQFHPTAVAWPQKLAGSLVSDAMRAEGGILYNDKGDRFMENYDSKRLELGTRDFVALAVHNEVASKRGSKHKGVWLDVRHREKEDIARHFPLTYKQFLDHGIDIGEDLIEVAPAAHCSMGGICVKLSGETNVPNLYAVGEAAAGLHGANRLGGNALAEALVFGKIVGQAAAKAAKRTRLEQLDYGEVVEKTKDAGRAKNSAKSVKKLRQQIQSVMWKHAGVVRSEFDLYFALDKIESVKKKLHKMHAGRKMGKDFADAWDLRHMTTAAEALVRSALLRKESRGAHYRSDYPVQDDRLLFNVVCANEGGKLKLRTEKVPHPHEEMLRLAVNLHSPVLDKNIDKTAASF